MRTALTLPAWLLGASYQAALSARNDGRIREDEWDAYRAVWFYSAPRFSELVSDLPRVRDVNAHLDLVDAHQTDDPHCTCNDCIEAFDRDASLFEETACTADLPWARTACPNTANGPDGFCQECRDAINDGNCWGDDD